MLTVLVCLSTIFGQPGDEYGGRTPTVYYGRPVAPTDLGIASRKLPMGRLVRVRNVRTGKTAIGRVIDRGPYGMKDADGWFNSRRKKNKARAAKLILEVGRKNAFLGCADFTPLLASAIGHDGKEEVDITVLPRGYVCNQPTIGCPEKRKLKRKRREVNLASLASLFKMTDWI